MSIADKLKEMFHFNWVSYLITRQTQPIASLAYQKRFQNQTEVIINQSKQDLTQMFPKVIPFADTLLAWLESHLPLHLGQNEKFPEIAFSNAPRFNLGLPADCQKSLKTFWEHAFYAGLLAKKLAEKIRMSQSVSSAVPSLDPTRCYILGWVHNFGFLLFAYLFYPEFCLLKKWMQLQPHVPIEILEKRLLGMGSAQKVIPKGHAELGAWLMEYWGLPTVFASVAKFHHQTIYKDYKDPDCPELLIIQLTNRLLWQIGIGEGAPISVQYACSKLGLSQKEAEAVLHTLVESSFLKEMVLHLAS